MQLNGNKYTDLDDSLREVCEIAFPFFNLSLYDFVCFDVGFYLLVSVTGLLVVLSFPGFRSLLEPIVYLVRLFFFEICQRNILILNTRLCKILR